VGVTYNLGMARGWESKSVEAQIEESRSSRPTAAKRALKAEQAQNQIRIKKSDLLLSRSRVLQQLENSSNERFNELMQRTLSDLDKQIAALAN
jgi:hypothetical protein